MNPQLHAGDGIATDGQLWISDKRIIVSGDSGFQFRVYGGLAYIVLISTDGADLNTVAMDGADAANNKPPMSTRTEMSNYKGCIRKPRSYPNPFNPSTTVLFDLPSGVSARYAVYDIRGRLVYSKAIKALPNIQVCRLSLKFNDMIPNQSTGSGSYFGKVESSDGKTYTHRLMLIR
jgi:hypothetical protein